MAGKSGYNKSKIPCREKLIRFPTAGRTGGDRMNREWLKSRRFKYILWSVILFVLMGGVYWYTHSSTKSAKTTAVRPAVQVETLARQDMMKRVVLSGSTVPKAEVDISPKYAGRIARVAVDLGDRVKAGDVLIQQDVRDLDISILQNGASSEQAAAEAVESRSQYGADIMKAQSDYDNALATYQRYQALYEQDAVALQERDDKYRAMMAARSVLDSLQNQQMGDLPAVVAAREAASLQAQYTVDALRQQRDDMTITAPRDGIIGYRQAEEGEWASAGQKLLTVVDNSLLYVDCDVSEQDIGILRPGMTLPVSIDSLGETCEGRITYISPSMDAATHSYQVRLTLDSQGGRILGGMFARTEVTAVQRPHTLFVPKEAVGDDNGKKYIFLIDEEGRARKAYVTLGLINDDSMEILAGAAEGDRVAVTNISRLRDGMEAEITAGGGA